LPSEWQRISGVTIVPKQLKGVAGAFVLVQEARHAADYDLSRRFYRQDVLAMIDRVEAAMADWSAIQTEPAARLYLISLLVHKKLQGR
jgi:hypothetical protein